MNPLLIAFLKEIGIPCILAVVRAIRQTSGRDPTDAEVLAALQLDTASNITFGKAWLDAHPPAA